MNNAKISKLDFKIRLIHSAILSRYYRKKNKSQSLLDWSKILQNILHLVIVYNELMTLINS